MKSFGLLTLCASLMASGSLSAQDASTRVAAHYPEHAVRMVVGFTAGGPTDVIARIIAEKLSTSVRQQFYVDNRPGAGWIHHYRCEHRFHGQYEPVRTRALLCGQGLCAHYYGRLFAQRSPDQPF